MATSSTTWNCDAIPRVKHPGSLGKLDLKPSFKNVAKMTTVTPMRFHGGRILDNPQDSCSDVLNLMSDAGKRARPFKFRERYTMPGHDGMPNARSRSCGGQTETLRSTKRLACPPSDRAACWAADRTLRPATDPNQARRTTLKKSSWPVTRPQGDHRGELL